MQKMQIGDKTLVKMTVQEYDEEYGVDLNEFEQLSISEVFWIEQHDEDGEVVGMSYSNAGLLENGNFVLLYDRGMTRQATWEEVMQEISNIEIFA